MNRLHDIEKSIMLCDDLNGEFRRDIYVYMYCVVNFKHYKTTMFRNKKKRKFTQTWYKYHKIH